MVKCLQVEDMTCITGGVDGQIRVWDLDRAIEFDCNLEENQGEQTVMNTTADVNPIESHQNPNPAQRDPCVLKLEGHSQSVTALYFDDACLVSQVSSFRGFLPLLCYLSLNVVFVHLTSHV
jgi:division protein 1